MGRRDERWRKHLEGKNLGRFGLLLALGILFFSCSPLEKIGEYKDKTLPTTAAKRRLAGLKEGEKVYFVVEVDGEVRSRGYRIRSRTEFRNRRAIVTETVQKTDVIRNNTRYLQTVQRKVITDEETGAALYSSEELRTGDEKITRTITINGTEAIFETNDATGAKSRKLKVPEGVMFGIEPDWLLRRKLKIGHTYECTVLDKNRLQLVKEVATVRGHRQEKVLGVEMEVWEVSLEREQGIPTRMTFTTAADLVRLQADTMVVRLVTAEEAERETPARQAVSTVATDFALPAWDNFNRLVYFAEPATAWRNHLKPSEYLQVLDQGERIEVHLLKVAPALPPSRLPMEVPEDIRVYLGKTETIRPDDSTIRKRARAIVGEERDTLQAVAIVTGWVYQNIALRPQATSRGNPVKILEAREGSVQEHADLFASLARSLGIPTRHCCGLLIQKNHAVYHAWVEVWLSGTWVPIDTTVNRVGLPACYLLTARDEGKGILNDPFVWTMHRGQLQLRLKSAMKQHKSPLTGEWRQFTLEPSVPRTYVAVNDNWLANLYWGFSVLKPEEWDGRITRSTVELTSADKLYTVTIEGIPQIFQATEMDLDRVVEHLQRSINHFRCLRSQIVLFGVERPSDALFVEFSSQQEGGQMARCRQYLVPKRGRSYRISVWGPDAAFETRWKELQAILDTIQF